MVKNIPTIERSTKVRFGKNALDDQAENTIVFNASNESLNANTANTIYISPIRLRENYDDPAIVLLMYNKDTKEVTESGEAATDIIETTLQGAALRGNVINVSTVYFNNVSHNSLVTDGNVGIVNTNPLHTFSVGSNLYVDDTGSNVLVVNGGVSIDGNLDVKGGITAITSNNLIIEDAIIELGKNNTSGDTTLDLGLIMGRPDSNVTVGFKEETDEIILAFTESSAYSNAIVPLTSEDINVHVYGRLYTESNVGVLNTNPMHTLDVGSNLYVDEFGPNILVVTGNTSVSGDLTVDTDTLFVDSSENKVGIKTVTPSAELHVVGNAYVSSNLTVDTETLHVDVVNDSIGVGTVNPSANLHVVGNVYVSSNLTVDTDTLHVDAVNKSVGLGTVDPSANLHVVGNVYVSSNLTVDTETLHVDAEASHVGVNTKNPMANLHVVGNVYVSSNLTVDTETFHVDAEASHVGVNTKTPNANLHVVGNVYVSSNVTTDGTLNLKHPTTALITDLTANVEVKLNQLANVVIDTATLANEDMLVYDGSNWTNQLQNHTFLYAKAEETIAKGDAVYATGSIGNNMFSIRKAQANSGATMPALGVAYQAFTLNQEGLIVTFGRADGVNTDNFQVGETVYVSAATAGALSNVKPYGPNDLIQNVGLVVKGNSNGIVNVTGVGRSNDIPNAPIVADEGDINYVYVNDANNDLKKILPTNLLTQLQTLQQVTDTGNTTSNTIQFTNTTTGLVTTSNLEVGSNISVAGLVDATNKHVPMVGTDGFLEKSSIYFTPGGKYVVSAAEAEFFGNLILSGNTSIISSNNVTIEDRIFGIGANNEVHNLDTGIMMEHKDDGEYANVAVIYHADEHRFSISYTQNTFSDDHILHYEDPDHIMLIDLRGNVEIQNNLVINETLNVISTSTFADDLTVGAVSNLFVDVSSSRVGINEASPTVSLDVGGDARVQDTTDAVSTTTGALVVSGGIGVASNIHSTNVYAGSHVGVGTNAATAPLHILVSGTGETTNGIYMKSAAGSATNDAIVNLEVASDGGDAFVTWNQAGGEAFAMGLDRSENDLVIANSSSDLTTNTRLRMATDGAVTLTNDTNSTSKTTGALIVGGGLGVTNDIYGAAATFDSLTVDTDTLIVDATNKRVGIETSSPEANLHVVGNVIVSSNLTVDTNTLHVDAEGNKVGILTVDPAFALDVHGTSNVGALTASSLSVDTDTLHVDATNKRVGIETSSPEANLHVVGNVIVSSNLTVDTNTLHVDAEGNKVGILTVDPAFALDVHGTSNVGALTATTLSVDTDTLHVDATNKRVGIETSSPEANLHVVGNVIVSSNLTVDTNTLHVDAEGNKVGILTVDPAYALDVHGTSNVGVLTATSLTVDTDTLHVDATNKRVGVETSSPEANLHVVGNVYVSANLEVGASALYVDTVSATSNVGIGTSAPEYSLDVVGDINFSGDLYQGKELFVSTPWTIEESPDALSYEKGNVGIGDANPAANLHVTGNVYVSSNLNVDANVFIAGGLVTNTSGVTKKTYSYAGTFPAGTTDAQATLDIVFAAEVFSAKITAHLVEDDTEISVLSLDVGGGHKSGGTSPIIFKGPLTIFGGTNDNPWSSTVTTSTTTTDVTVSIKPTQAIQALITADYNIFVEYVSAASGGQLKQINDHQTSPVTVTFGY
jgi:hypothetical protein